MISVCSRTSGVSVFKSIVLEKIPAFLLAQKSTIRNHLSLAIDNITFDVSPILHDQLLQLISCFHDISLTLPYANEILRSQLYPDCTVNPYAVLSTLRREWCSVKLPHLRNLAIRIGSANLYSACLSGGGRVVTEVEALKRDVWLWRGLVPCDRCDTHPLSAVHFPSSGYRHLSRSTPISSIPISNIFHNKIFE